MLTSLFTVHSQDEGQSVAEPYFGIQVVDEETGKGIPLVELQTVNDIRLVTDNAGWIAFYEPGLMNREVFWHVSGPGIERQKDGFGFAGLRAKAIPGASAAVKVKNTNIAVRIGRLTGQGLYRDSESLGLTHPLPNVLEPGVTGQDSVQAAPYRGKIFWLWGDTNIARYPLGNFHTTCALTDADAEPEKGLLFDYFIDPANPERLRKMMPSPSPGVVWMFGLASLTDAAGEERLFSGFSRQQGLVPPDERGIAEFDEGRGQFRKVADVGKDDQWHMPAGCSVRVKTEDGDHFYFCTPFAYRRVEANAESIVDPKRYEMFVFDKAASAWRWTQALEPTTGNDEQGLLKSGTMKREQARYQVVAADSGAVVTMHTASIRWNAWRKKFVLLGIQTGGKESFLGEAWYAESNHVTGPWLKAVKIASHPKYSFYNIVWHSFFDKQDGRILYFEGTYTRMFSSSPVATPRYDYNQLMYRLDLSDPRLHAAH